MVVRQKMRVSGYMIFLKRKVFLFLLIVFYNNIIKGRCPNNVAELGNLLEIP